MTAGQSSSVKALGKVYLIGAGPGDPELLTRKAFRVLQDAGVVLHDDLVAPEILALVPGSATIFNVGKRCGRKTMTQDEIHARMINAARDGYIVARLKGGDPLVYGRAGEELQALCTASINFEVIPGVTAAFAAAAAAQIPLTDRRFASRILFLTGHRCDSTASGIDGLKGLTRDSTVVIYMPGERITQIARQLKAAGLRVETPCVVVSAASTSRQQIYRLTLQKLLDAPRLPPPAILIVGEIVGHSPTASKEYIEQRNELIEFATMLRPGIQNELARFAMRQHERNEFAVIQKELPSSASKQNLFRKLIENWRRLMCNFAEAWYG